MTSAPLDPSIEALLAQSKFTSIYRDWLPERRERLAHRLRTRPGPLPARVLLVNATLGVTFYPEIVDFFIEVQKAHPRTRFVSSTYFTEIFELERGIVARGVRVASMARVLECTAVELNRFDLIIAIGASEALARIMTIEGLTAKVVLLDLAFYHQLIAASDRAFLEREGVSPALAAQEKVPTRVTCYTCQPATKVRADLRRHFALSRFDWRPFSYIPVGFGRAQYYRSERHAFDVALLGAAGRDYALLDPGLLAGLRVLFIGSTEGAAWLDRLRSALDVTVMQRVSEDVYARLLSLCRCVVMPVLSPSHNCFMSVVDALASGVPLLTARRVALELLDAEGAPLTYYEEAGMVRNGSEELMRATRARTASSLADAIRKLLRDEPRRKAIAAASIEFARNRLDIYAILETILREQSP